MEKRIAAAGEPNGAKTIAGHLIDQVTEARKRNLLFRAQALLIAEVAGHIAAVREVELRMDGAARRGSSDDGVDDFTLPLR